MGRPKKHYLQLAVPFGLNEFAIQPNLLARGKTLRLDSFIMGSFFELLGMVEIFAIYNHQFSEFFCQLIRRLELGTGVHFFLVRHARVVATVQLKRRVTRIGVLRVVVGELHH